jgi:hypothetical protein
MAHDSKIPGYATRYREFVTVAEFSQRSNRSFVMRVRVITWLICRNYMLFATKAL